MPDRHGFDHLTARGETYHRCIEPGCSWPPEQRLVDERARAAHAAKHARDRRLDIERRRLDNLRLARRLQAQADRENARAYGEASS